MQCKESVPYFWNVRLKDQKIYRKDLRQDFVQWNIQSSASNIFLTVGQIRFFDFFRMTSWSIAARAQNGQNIFNNKKCNEGLSEILL